MSKIGGFLASFVLAVVSATGATFTNTGSASWGCQGFDQNGHFAHITESATGTSFDFDCPPGFSGTMGSASVGNLTARASAGYGPGAPDVALQSTFTGSLIPTGGTGSGTVEFTLTYSFSGLEDLAFLRGGGDLFFNGVQVASLQPGFCFTPLGFPRCDLPQNVVKIVDEPITYGQPFTYQADDFMSGGGTGFGVSNQVTITASLLTGGELIEVPEPATLGFVSLALLGLPLISSFGRSKRV